MIVVDASVFVDALGDDGELGEIARLRLIRESASASPDIVELETATALRRHWLMGKLEHNRLLDAIDDLRSLPIDRHRSLDLLPRAIELRHTVTVADGLYIALAEALDVPLLTTDRRLAGAPGIRCEVEVLL